MNVESQKFIAGIDQCRSWSSFLATISLGLMIVYELDITGMVFSSEFSSLPSIVFALAAIFLRLTAMDRFFQMTRQMDTIQRE